MLTRQQQNWFQNRRARDKKERNIREYEERQRIEREKNGKQPGGQNFPGRNSHLVASSAPFPNTRNPSPSGATSREQSSGPDQDSEAAGSYLSDGSGDPSELDAMRRLPESLFGFASTEDQARHGSRGYPCTSPSNGTSDANEPDLATMTDEEDGTDCFVKPTHPSIRFSPSHSFSAYDLEDFAGFQSNRPSPEDVDPLRSPPSIDIASRRNRKPPPLAISGSCRGYPSGPMTSIDLGRRGNPMRRVASAGPGRVQKPSAVPRSPFPMSRSPLSTGRKSSNNPPTPDTPMLKNQSSTGSNAGSVDSGNIVSESELAARDPTLRTPPTTPGRMQNYLSLNGVYGLSMAESGVPVPAMAGFAPELAPSVSMGQPNYVTNTHPCMSQPQTPSFVSPVSSSSYGFTRGSADYTWSDSVIPGDQSPTDQQFGSPFFSLPLSGFSMET